MPKKHPEKIHTCEPVPSPTPVDVWALSRAFYITRSFCDEERLGDL
jgi:hypothetical protein